jgi:hypothetical protein
MTEILPHRGVPAALSLSLPQALADSARWSTSTRSGRQDPGQLKDQRHADLVGESPRGYRTAGQA